MLQYICSRCIEIRLNSSSQMKIDPMSHKECVNFRYVYISIFGWHLDWLDALSNYTPQSHLLWKFNIHIYSPIILFHIIQFVSGKMDFHHVCCHANFFFSLIRFTARDSVLKFMYWIVCFEFYNNEEIDCMM